MTSIVGIACSDGVVIGTDSAATFGDGSGRPTIEQPVNKIEVINDQVIIAGTGAVGLNQRFCHMVQVNWSARQFRERDIFQITKDVAKAALEDFQHTYVTPPNPPPLRTDYGALVAIPCGHNYHLCEFAAGSLQPELKNSHPWYCSMGSAQTITDAFLGFIKGVFWENGQPTLADGVLYAVWTLQQAIELNPGGVNAPIRVAVLERPQAGLRARLLSPGEVDQHQQHIAAAKEHLRNFKYVMSRSDATEVPSPPKL